MNAPSVMPSETLPVLIDRATAALEAARNSAEILEARDMARVAYDAAKSAGRMARAKQAHDRIVAKVHRSQAHALAIRARAEMRLAQEYDDAQGRGEVASLGGNRGNQFASVSRGNAATSSDLDLARKDIHEARQFRNAEEAEPGAINRALDGMIKRGQEPTRAALRRSVLAAVDDAASRPRREKNPLHKKDAARDRVFAFSGLCRSLAEYDDVELIAAWSAIPQTAERLPTDVRNAMLILSRFLEAKDA